MTGLCFGGRGRVRIRVFVRCSPGHGDGLLVNDAAAFRPPGFPGGGARRQQIIGAAMLPARWSTPGVQGVDRFAVGPPGTGRTRPRRPIPAAAGAWRRASCPRANRGSCRGPSGELPARWMREAFGPRERVERGGGARRAIRPCSRSGAGSGTSPSMPALVQSAFREGRGALRARASSRGRKQRCQKPRC